MNYKVYPLLILIVLMIDACSNKKTSDQESDTSIQEQSDVNTAAPDTESESELAMTGKPSKMDQKTSFQSLQGGWMSDAYLSEIEKTKSVLAGSKVVKGMLGFNIIPDETHPERLWSYDYSAHEGGGQTTLIWDAETQQYWTDKNLTHSHSTGGIYFRLLNKDLIEVSFEDERPPEQYRRAKEPDAVNEILFAGAYLHGNQQVILLPDGSIHRNPDVYEFSAYRVVQDFFDCQMDQIIFTSEMGDFPVHYKIKNDKIELYHFNFIHPGNCEYSELHSELIKQGDSDKTSNQAESASNPSKFYYDLPRETKTEFINVLQTNNDLSWSQKTKDILLDFLNKTVLSGHSQFGPLISSNYFWHVYNALPDFVDEKERHNGYYRGEADQNQAERLKAYALYRMDRSPENIRQLFEKVKPQLTTILPPSSYHNFGIADKMRSLDLAYQELTAIENHKQKLETFFNKIYTDQGAVILEGNTDVKEKWEDGAYGFSSHELAEMLCQELGIDRFSSAYGSPDLTFWMRRQHEGNFDAVYEILAEIHQLYQ